MTDTTSLLRNVLKGPNNESFDAGRILWVSSMACHLIGGLVLEYLHVRAGNPFDMSSFGIGYAGGAAALLAAGGVGVSQKDRGVARAQATAASVSE